MNRVVFIGRLTSDPELRELPNGTKACHLRIAVDGAARNGEAGFFNLGQYEAGGEVTARVLKRGRQLAFDGRAEHRTWQAKDTSRQATAYVGQIDFLSDRGALPESGRRHAAMVAAHDG